MQDQAKSCVTNAPENPTRRKAVKKLVVGAGLLAGYSVLPGDWTKPIVGQMALPAHAATSGPVTAAATVAAAPVAAAPVAAAPGSFNSSQTYALRGFAGNNKRFTWLDQTGRAYGGTVKFVYSGGGELVVPNAAVTHGADGNTGNHDQAFYFCGTDFAAGSAENNGGRASVFAPPGNGSATVTMYWNK